LPPAPRTLHALEAERVKKRRVRRLIVIFTVAVLAVVLSVVVMIAPALYDMLRQAFRSLR
jgi:cell division septal protein FtsQ